MIPHMSRVSFLLFGRFNIYITESALCWLLPTRFARFLLRVMMYPGGSPLMIRTASTSSTGASSFSPAHALLDTSTFLQDSIPLQMRDIRVFARPRPLHCATHAL